jgi:hypothetical protein
MPKICVIFLPGILGSPLVNDSNDRAWPVHEFEERASLALYFSSLTLKGKIQRFTSYREHGVVMHRTRILESSVDDSGKSHNVAIFYRDFVKALYLKQDPFSELPFEIDLVVMNYNWVNTVETTANKVLMATRRIANRCDGFMYVTHSMGGVVAMDAILLIAREPKLKEKLLGVVRVACPVTGAPETVARLHRGIEYKYDWGDWDTWSTKNYGERLAAQMLGVTGWEFSLLAAHIPGISSLLPGNISQSIITSIVCKPFMPEAVEQKSLLGVNEAWAYGRDNLEHIKSLTEKHWNAARASYLARVNEANELLWEKFVHAVVLTGKRTTMKVDYFGLPIETDMKGDGTVPAHTQGIYAGEVTFVSGGIDHADAFSDRMTWPAIVAAMKSLFMKWIRREGGDRP